MKLRLRVVDIKNDGRLAVLTFAPVLAQMPEYADGMPQTIEKRKDWHRDKKTGKQVSRDVDVLVDTYPGVHDGHSHSRDHRYNVVFALAHEREGEVRFMRPAPEDAGPDAPDVEVVEHRKWLEEDPAEAAKVAALIAGNEYDVECDGAPSADSVFTPVDHAAETPAA